MRRISYPLGSVAAGTVLSTANTTTYLTAATVAVTGPDGQTVPGIPTNGIPVQGVDYIALDVNISAITGVGAALTVTVDRYGDDGVWYNIYTSSALNSTGSTSVNLGPGESTNVELGSHVRVGFFVSNTASPSVTLSASVRAKS